MTDVIDTRPETRRRRKAERPQEILDAAFQEFSRNGYATTLSYTGGQLSTVTDPAGRQLTFSYDAAGHLTTSAGP